MEDNAYNREIARQLAEITNKYIDHQKRTGKEMRNSSLVPLTGPMTAYGRKGGNIFSDIGETFGDLSPLVPLAMNLLGGKRKGGEIKTVPDSTLTPSNIQAPAQVIRSGNGEYARGIGGADFSKMGAEMGNLADNLFERFGHMASFALGKEGGKKKRGRPSKKGKGLIGSIFPPARLFGLGEEIEGGKKKRGRPSKKGKGLIGSIFPPARLFGLGQEGEQMEGGSWLGSVIPFGDMMGLGQEMQGGKRKRGRPRKAGSIGVDLMAETKKNLLTGGKVGGFFNDELLKPLSFMGNALLDVGKDIGKEAYKRSINSLFDGKGQMQAGGWMDDFINMGKAVGSQALNVGKDIGKEILKENIQRGKKALRGAVNKKVSEFLGEEKPRRPRRAKKAGQMEGSGWFDDVLDAGKNALRTSVEVLPDVVQLAKLVKGKGAKCGGKKTSPWIAHCKAFAKKHNMSYRDALKDARCKSSYKK
jgi:hypothetical protein